MLRGTVALDEELLSIYDRTLVEAGTLLILSRERFLRALSLEAQRAHSRFTAGAERLDVEYDPDVAFEAPTVDAVQNAFEARLRHVAEAERTRKAAVAGPHRDDVRLTLRHWAFSDRRASSGRRCSRSRSPNMPS